MFAPDEDRERRLREASFHDQWAASLDLDKTLVDETFTSISAMENQFILTQFGDLKGARILDYGCGAAEAGVYFAKLGASVVGIDVSPGMLESARTLAGLHGVSIETRRVDGDRLPADDAEFDLVYGNGVLHHVNLEVVKPELARVIRPGGTGCFIEPLAYNPAIDVYRHLANTVRTRDERPLTFDDIESLATCFEQVAHREFWFLTLSVFLKFLLVDRVHPRKERYWKKIYTDAPRIASWFAPLRRMDDALLGRWPALRSLCWTTVITAKRPRASCLGGRGAVEPGTAGAG